MLSGTRETGVNASKKAGSEARISAAMSTSNSPYPSSITLPNATRFERSIEALSCVGRKLPLIGLVRRFQAAAYSPSMTQRTHIGLATPADERLPGP